MLRPASFPSTPVQFPDHPESLPCLMPNQYPAGTTAVQRSEMIRFSPKTGSNSRARYCSRLPLSPRLKLVSRVKKRSSSTRLNSRYCQSNRPWRVNPLYCHHRPSVGVMPSKRSKGRRISSRVRSDAVARITFILKVRHRWQCREKAVTWSFTHQRSTHRKYSCWSLKLSINH